MYIKIKKAKNFSRRRNEEALDWLPFSAAQCSVCVAGWHWIATDVADCGELWWRGRGFTGAPEGEISDWLSSKRGWNHPHQLPIEGREVSQEVRRHTTHFQLLSTWVHSFFTILGSLQFLLCIFYIYYLQFLLCIFYIYYLQFLLCIFYIYYLQFLFCIFYIYYLQFLTLSLHFMYIRRKIQVFRLFVTFLMGVKLGLSLTLREKTQRATGEKLLTEVFGHGDTRMMLQKSV